MADVTKSKKSSFSFFKLLGWLIIFLFLFLVAVFIFPTPVLRLACPYIESKTGITAAFDKASFSLSDGVLFNLDGLSLYRTDHPTGNFDIQVESFRMPAMFPNDFRLPVISIAGLSGTYERVGNEGIKKDQDQNQQNVPVFQALMLSDAKIDVIDHTLDIPFQTTVTLDEFSAVKTGHRSFMEPYTCIAVGSIGSSPFSVGIKDDKHIIEIDQVPLELFAPYAPILNDIFAAGGMNIKIDDLTDETQKRARLAVTLLPTCEIKSADKIIMPALQAALRQSDQVALPELSSMQEKMDRLKTASERLSAEMENAFKIVDALKVLAPRDVQQKYEKIRGEYDRIKPVFDSWDTLLKDLDQIKANVVHDTFRRFINTGNPIVIDLQEIDGAWQYDAYEAAVRLVDENYREVIASQYQQRLQELQNAIERLETL